MSKLLGLLKKFKNKKLRVILDTCVLIDYFDGTGDIDYIKKIIELMDEGILEGYVSVVTISEIVKHLNDLAKYETISNNSIVEILNSIKDNFSIISLEYSTAYHSGEIKSKYSTKSRPLSYNDAFIASIAKSLGIPLITCDGEFFEDRDNKNNSRISGVDIFTPRAFEKKIDSYKRYHPNSSTDKNN